MFRSWSRRFIVSSILIAVLFSSGLANAQEGEKKPWVMMTLKTGVDDLETIYHVFMIGGALAKEGARVTVVLYFEGARIADARQPLDFQWAKQPESLQQMYDQYVVAGGEILVCPLCASNIGLDAKNVRKGSIIGTKQAILDAIMKSDKIMDF